MAAIQFNQLKGQGYLYPVALSTSGLGSEKTWSIGAPTCSGSAFLTFEAVRSLNAVAAGGYYDSESSTPGLATFSDFVGIDKNTLITSQHKFSVVIPPGGGSFKYTPTIFIPSNTFFARGTGGITLNSI
tara:strand:+ start:1013 stop:1399 length:387 start_codon:yes stop_codon:yes gene_type:complete